MVLQRRFHLWLCFPQAWGELAIREARRAFCLHTCCCVRFDFDYYHNALQAMGFVAQQHHGEHNLFLGWRYTKFKKSDGTVDMTISIVQMAGNEPGHLCVESIGTLN